MAESLGRRILPAGFRAALIFGWPALIAAGGVYAHFQRIPSRVAIPALAAFFIEYPFYLLPAFPEIHKRLSGAVLPLFFVVSILLPYAVCYSIIGPFYPGNLVKLAALALVCGLWYLVLPSSVISDLAFLGLVGTVLLSRYFESIYPAVYPRLPLSILGRIALFHMAVLALILQRHIRDTGYGFLPSPREWRIGALHYLYFLPAAAVLAFPLKMVRLAPPAPLWKTIGIFLAFLWVVGLFEEFIFRGVLQQWLEDWIRSSGFRLAFRTPQAAALFATSVIFGSAHLWFRGFPNWRWALLAGVLGWFCGRARNQAGGIRAGVVTHALVVATWRGFFV
jgi:uncharacterized protein